MQEISSRSSPRYQPHSCTLAGMDCSATQDHRSPPKENYVTGQRSDSRTPSRYEAASRSPGRQPGPSADEHGLGARGGDSRRSYRGHQGIQLTTVPTCTRSLSEEPLQEAKALLQYMIEAKDSRGTPMYWIRIGRNGEDQDGQTLKKPKRAKRVSKQCFTRLHHCFSCSSCIAQLRNTFASSNRTAAPSLFFSVAVSLHPALLGRERRQIDRLEPRKSEPRYALFLSILLSLNVRLASGSIRPLVPSDRGRLWSSKNAPLGVVHKKEIKTATKVSYYNVGNAYSLEVIVDEVH